MATIATSIENLLSTTSFASWLAKLTVLELWIQEIVESDSMLSNIIWAQWKKQIQKSSSMYWADQVFGKSQADALLLRGVRPLKKWTFKDKALIHTCRITDLYKYDTWFSGEGINFSVNSLVN